MKTPQRLKLIKFCNKVISIILLYFLSLFQLSAQNGNLIENPSFEQFSNCTNFNQFQCGCYPDAFYQGCLVGPWQNATGSSALSNHWLNNGPVAQAGEFYAQTQQRIKHEVNGSSSCGLYETFYYNFLNGNNNISRLYAGQPYKLRLWYYGYNIVNQVLDYKYNVHVDAVTGLSNQTSPTPLCNDQNPSNVEAALHLDNLNSFSSWIPAENDFTLNSDKTQLWFRPEVVSNSFPVNTERKIHVLYDNISLTCNSLMTTEIQYTQNGSNYTFTLVKTGGPADAQIANVDWTFGDGTTGNGNPITKTILGTVPIKVFANFTDSRGCTKKTNLILPSCGCSGNPTIVSNTQTWNTPITSAGNIVMMPGARLTVQANLKMGPDCKIFVLNGARLNVNNATIDVDDSSCNGVRWGGIEVLGAGNTVGHPALSTITANNAYPAFAEHGVAYLNHATINRAQTAIQTEQKGIFLGGIVVADVTNFNDNIIGADIGPFSQDNVSQFIECQFIGVPLLSTPGILTNHFAVRLTQNKGVQIRGGVHTGGIIRNYQYGIWAANFSYYLNSQVINTAYGGAVNINTGVNPTQVKIGIGKPGYIDGKNNFESGDYGVYSDGPMNCDINQNTFETKYGTVNYGVNDSRITNNFFLNNSAGIYLNNTTNPSSMGSVKLDCNTFSNLTHGILAYQSNKTSTFESNFFENIQASDVEVYGTSGVQGTMQKIMGSLQKGITNIFSSPIEDFKVSSNTIHHTYIAQNLLNNTYGNAWIPRCPDNPSPLYDFDCNYTSNFNRFRLDNQLFANCLTNKTIPPIIDESDCRSFGCLINYINSLNNVIDTVVDYSSTENYWNLLKIKESSYNSLFAKYLEDNNTDSLTILLSLENTETNKDRRIQYLVYTHNYSTAKSLIQSLPSQTRDEIDRIVLWYINIDRVEKDSNFFLQPNDRLFLNDVINNQRLYAPRAMAILSITDGVLFDPILPTDTLEQRSNVAQNVKGLNIYPNPASNEISIEIPDFDNGVENTYTIYSLDGVQRLNGKINSQKQQVDLSQLCNGFYIVKLTIAGKMTSKKLIISTH